jgi:hypothetical protein
MNVLSMAQVEEMAQDKHQLRHMMVGLARVTASLGYRPDDTFTWMSCGNQVITSPIPLEAKRWINEHQERWFYMVMSEVEIQRIERQIIHPLSDLGVPTAEVHPPFEQTQGGNGHVH